jgi:hypothetical protein
MMGLNGTASKEKNECNDVLPRRTGWRGGLCLIRVEFVVEVAKQNIVWAGPLGVPNCCTKERWSANERKKPGPWCSVDIRLANGSLQKVWNS